MNAEQIRHARAMLADPEASISSIARLIGVSRTTLYKYGLVLVGSTIQLSPFPRGTRPSVTACDPWGVLAAGSYGP
jgi:hypothetical protein